MCRSVAMIILFLALSACGLDSLAPSEAVPAAAPKRDARQHVAFCYTSETTTPRQLQDLARAACGAGFAPRFVASEYSLSACPLLQPARVTFACERKGGY